MNKQLIYMNLFLKEELERTGKGYITFYYSHRWLYGMERGEYPPQVKWIKLGSPKTHVTREDLLTPEEIKRLIHHGENSRDRAAISVLWEDAFRVNELLTATIGSVEATTWGYRLTVKGKTGDRTVPITMARGYLAEWLNDHPKRTDLDAPLWVNLGKKEKLEPLGYAGMYGIIKKTARRAGIQKKVYPHLLRHTRLTELSVSLREPVLRKHAGWTPRSSMPAVYVHLGGADVEREVLAANGVTEVEKPKPVLQQLTCPRCLTADNPPTALYCTQCSAPIGEVALPGENHAVIELKGQINELMRQVRELREIQQGRDIEEDEGIFEKEAEE